MDMSTSRVRVGVVTSGSGDDNIDHLDVLGGLEISFVGPMTCCGFTASVLEPTIAVCVVGLLF